MPEFHPQAAFPRAARLGERGLHPGPDAGKLRHRTGGTSPGTVFLGGRYRGELVTPRHTHANQPGGPWGRRSRSKSGVRLSYEGDRALWPRRPVQRAICNPTQYMTLR